MNISGSTAGFSRLRLANQISVFLLWSALLFATWPQNVLASQDAQAEAQTAQAPEYTQQTPEQMQQLVAPIALYPDSLVAQILAASTFPEQAVEADRWMQEHPDLKGDDLGQAVDQQRWDPSVKALTVFPSVLGNMDKNLAWTSSLGDAYYNQQQDLLDAIQVMRQRAEGAGNLKTTPQQTVTTEDSTTTIQPASPDVVYVPAYNPWSVYGVSIVVWPGWYRYPGIWYGGPHLSFGVGFAISFYGGFGWSWANWGFDWDNRVVTYNHNRYYSRSKTFYNRNNRGGGARAGVYNRPGATTTPSSANTNVSDIAGKWELNEDKSVISLVAEGEGRYRAEGASTCPPMHLVQSGPSYVGSNEETKDCSATRVELRLQADDTLSVVVTLIGGLRNGHTETVVYHRVH